MASLWTASYPVQTGVLRYQHALSEEAMLPAEILRQAGFKTGGVWRNGWVAPNFGFDQGFDVYYRPVASRAGRDLRAVNPSAPPLLPNDADLTESAQEFIRTFGMERFFLYVHYMDVHQYVYSDETALFGATLAFADFLGAVLIVFFIVVLLGLAMESCHQQARPNGPATTQLPLFGNDIQR
jgi:hypothetical protein